MVVEENLEENLEKVQDVVPVEETPKILTLESILQTKLLEPKLPFLPCAVLLYHIWLMWVVILMLTWP